MTAHKWTRDVGERCSLCGLGRMVDAFSLPQGPRYRMSGLQGFAALNAIRAPEPFMLRQFGGSRGQALLWVTWGRVSPSERECLLAIDYQVANPWTETRILLPCPGKQPATWKELWIAHLSRLLLAAAAQSCRRCRAGTGEWCRTPSSHPVPGLHRERLKEQHELQAGIVPAVAKP